MAVSSSIWTGGQVCNFVLDGAERPLCLKAAGFGIPSGSVHDDDASVPQSRPKETQPQRAMEEIDELRAKAIASMTSGGNPNSRSKRKSTSKEEGEVSSDDEEVPTCSRVNSTANTSAEHTSANSKREDVKRLRSGNVLQSGCSPSTMADMQQRTFTLENHNKMIKWLPNKSHSRAWHGRSGSNDNLIISFSDGDDSDTDSKEANSERTVGERGDKNKVDRSSRRSRVSHLRPDTLQYRSSRHMKILPTKISTGRPLISSVSKTQGAYSKSLGPSGAPTSEKETPFQIHGSTNKNLLNQELGHVSDVSMADDKVETLRQQIAVRENELRLQKRSIPESKDRIACLDEHFQGNSIKLDARAPIIDSSFSNIPSSKEIRQLKPDQQPSNNVSSEGLLQVQPPLVDSTSKTKAQASETSGHLDAVIGSHEGTDGTALGKNDVRLNEPHREINSSICVSSDIFQLQIKDKELLMTANQADDSPCKERISSPPKTSLQDTNFISYANEIMHQEQSSMDRDALLRVEALHDKELEEAQELRHNCELEEMRALRAYRKAREALIAANSRCSFLYRRRELLSLLASRCLSHRETVPRTSNDLLSELNRMMDAEGQDLDQVGYKCSTPHVDALPLITSNLRTDGDNVKSYQCCKHDANVLMDDGQSFPIDNASVRSKTIHENGEVNVGLKTVDIVVESERTSPVQHVHDFELEASLRSKLVARLGVKSTANSGAGSYSTDRTIAKESEVNDEKERSNTCMWIVPSLTNQQFQEKERIVKGTENSARSISPLPGKMIQSDGDDLLLESASDRNSSPVDDNPYRVEPRGPKQTTFLPTHSVLHPICKHFKLVVPESSILQKEVIDDGFLTSDRDTTSDRDMEHNMCSSGLATLGFSKLDFTIDPFWPLCTFELRGKCNDEECPWQHLKGCAEPKTMQHYSTSFSSDNQVGYSENYEKVNDVNSFPRGRRHNIMSIPTYRIGSNIMKFDMQLSQSVLARSMWQYWQFGFCTFFPLPFSVQRILPPDALFLHASDVYATDGDNSNRPSLYLSSEDSKMKQLKQGMSDPDEALELALDFLNRKVNNTHVRNKALSLLARAIEANPFSVVLWVVYLQVYYGKEKSIGKDDMFLHAVRLNEGSYELWHLYIHSRMHSDDQMNAYNNALSVLCQQIHSLGTEHKYVSACILDLSLQMIDFLCMRGDVDKAVSHVYELLSPTTDLRTSDHILLSDILPCLITSDRCIFWICCIYVVVYRKLPEAIVQQLELEKDLPFVMEWPSTHLSVEEKHRALELMEKAVDVLILEDDTNLCEKDHSLGNVRRSAHFMAITHINCVATVHGLDSATELLAKYVKMYPTCVELHIISIRLQKISTEEAFIEDFEEALRNWPKAVPGSQCLWNQCAEYALDCGRVDFAEKLVEHWFHSFCETQSQQCRGTEARIQCLHKSSELLSPLIPGATFYSSKMDTIFGLLNLCLYKLLQKNIEEARLAVDEALELATEQEFRQCVREHAAFLFFSSSFPVIDGTHRAIWDLLNGYLRDVRSCSALEPLSRRFCRNVKKPKLKKLISGLFGPVSSDFSFLNSVLEVLYGPSLLPKTFKGAKDLVDYVESLMVIMPANYHLALSVYNFLHCNHNAFASRSMMFWVSSLLVNSIFQSFPVAPESVWLEAVNVLRHVDIPGISEAFHQQAVSVYPFSLKLWQSYLNLSKTTGNNNAVLEAAKTRGFDLEVEA